MLLKDYRVLPSYIVSFVAPAPGVGHSDQCSDLTDRTLTQCDQYGDRTDHYLLWYQA